MTAIAECRGVVEIHATEWIGAAGRDVAEAELRRALTDHADKKGLRLGAPRFEYHVRDRGPVLSARAEVIR